MNDLLVTRELIDTYNDAYYNTGKQLITDKEYDALLSHLRDYCPDDPRLVNVGAEPTLDKVSHKYPMGSLDNIDSSKSNELENYINKTKEVRSNCTYHITPKIDGSSIAITYEKGVLVQALTRGNGEVGQDITAKLRHFKQVPLTLPKPIDIVVRGEAVMHRDDFLKYIENEELEGVRNPRNIGNGIVVRKDCKGSSLIHFYAFNTYRDGDNFDTVETSYNYMTSLGFTTPTSTVVSDIAGVRQVMDTFLDCKYPFDVDGLVIKMNELGAASVYNDGGDVYRPRSDKAIKFNNQKAETVITGVTITVGHTGKITPTLIVDAVEIGGVVVKNPLVYNFEEPKRLGIGIGDKIQIILAGNVIPKVMSIVDKSPHSVPIGTPTNCPICNSELKRKQLIKGDSVDIYCENKDCPGIKREKISKFIGSSKTGMGILGIGDETIDMLIEKKMLNSPTDLYCLTVDQLKDLPMGVGIIGEKRAQTIYDNIQKSKSNPISQVIASLGVETLGHTRAKLMISMMPDQLQNLPGWVASRELIVELKHKHLPPSHLKLISDQISDDLASLIYKLHELGVGKIESATPETSESGPLPFKDLVFCFTGTRQMVDKVEAMGGKISDGVSKNVNFLVQKDSTSVSSKSKKAVSLGIPVIGLVELEAMITSAVSA